MLSTKQSHRVQLVLSSQQAGWALLKKGALFYYSDPHPQSWKHNFGSIFMTKISIETKIKAIEEWIDYYNHRQIQTKLGNLTPLQYEARLAA